VIVMKINKDLKELIESNPVSVSTVNSNKVPHTIYVMYIKIIGEDKILITDNYMKKTKENILQNNKVALSILVGDAAFELNGIAEYFSVGDYVEQVKKIPENKGFPCKGAIVVTVEDIVKMS